MDRWLVAGAALATCVPLLLWARMWRATPLRAAEAQTFHDSPRRVDRRRQITVPLILWTGSALTMGFALAADNNGSEAETGDPHLTILGAWGALAALLAVGVLPLLTLLIAARVPIRLLPRVIGEEPTEPVVSARADRYGRFVGWFFTPIMTFCSIGVATGFHSAWAGSTVILAWPIADMAARSQALRLEIRRAGIVLGSQAYDYYWRAKDVEAVFPEGGSEPQRGVIALRDRAGWEARALTTPLRRERITGARDQLVELGYRIGERSGESRWRPNVPAVVIRRPAPMTLPRVLVAIWFVLQAVLTGALGATS